MANPKSLDFIEGGETYRAVQIFGEGADGNPALIYMLGDAIKVSAEVTSMPEGPYVFEEGRFDPLLLVGGANSLAAGDYIQKLTIGGGLAINATASASILIRNAAAATLFEFNTAVTQICPGYFEINVNIVMPDAGDIFVQSAVYGTNITTGDVHAIGRFA